METRRRIRTRSFADPENLIGACATMLSIRDFTACRRFALQIPRSDPNISDCVDQILAIIDVLGAAERRLNRNHFDWYAILQLSRVDAGNHELLRRQFYKLVRLLNPTKNNFPFSNDALMRVHEAWSVLSDPERRALFEKDIDNPQQQDAPNQGRYDIGDDQTATFWTMCPYCWYLYEYEKKYEDCSFRCENCGKTFHGVAVNPPAKEMIMEGEQQYYCYNVSIPGRYPVKETEKGMEDKNMGEQSFVYISGGDEVGRAATVKVGNEGIQDNARYKECDRVVQGNGRTELQGNGKRRMRVKTVAKKIVGNRMRSQGYLDPNSNWDLDAEDGELEFTEGDGDIFIGVRFTN